MQKKSPLSSFLSLSLFFSASSASLCFVSSSAADEPTYWKDIRPVLRKHCIVCHSTKNLKEPDVSGGLALDSYEAVIKGPKRSVVIPSKSKDSLLIQLVRSEDDDKRMPKDALPLEPEKIDLLARWIDAGAKEGTKPDTVASVVAPTSSPQRLRRLDVVLPTNVALSKQKAASGASGKLELVLKAGPLAPVTAVAFSPDGQWLAAGSYGHVTLWDLAAGKPVKSLTNVLGTVNDLRFSADGKVLVAAGGQPSFRGDLRLFDTQNWQLLGTLGGHEDVVFSTSFSPDGKRLASASFDKTVRVWDLATRKQQLTITSHSDFVYSVAFSPDGQRLVSGSKDRSVKVSDAKTGKSLMTFSGMDQDVLAVAISPDGKNIVSGGYDNRIFWWNPETAQRLRAQAGHRVAIHELCFSRDGKLLVSAGADGSARLWNAGNGEQLTAFLIGAETYAVAISADGRKVATGSFDGFVRLWDTGTRRQLATMLTSPPLQGGVDWLALSPEGCVDVSDDLKSQVIWRIGGRTVEADDVWKAVQQPGLLAKLLRGEKLPAPRFEK